MAIGQYVAQLHRTLGAADRAVDSMVDAVAPEMREQLRLTMAEQPKPARKATLAVTTTKRGKK